MARTGPWIAGVVVAGALGFLAGRGMAPEPEPPEECPAVPAVSAVPSVQRAPDREPGVTPAPEEAEEVEIARETVRELEEELYGIPVPWTPDIDADHQPAAVKARIRQVIEDCGVKSRLIDVDCDEVPCFAVLDTTGVADGYAEVMGCPTWTDAWGQRVGTSNRTVACPDGSTRELLMLTPGTEHLTEAELMERMASGSTPEERAKSENDMKRMNARAAAAEDALCAR